jgi:hypothetical protein
MKKEDYVQWKSLYPITQEERKQFEFIMFIEKEKMLW